MVSSALKPAVNRVIEPIARTAIRARVTPNAVTLLGTLGTVISALFFYPRGHLFLGTIVISIFALSDLFDGAIARLSEKGASAWGGFLDSTCDRVTDAAILGGLAIYCILEEISIYPIVILTIVIGFLVPYIRAKAESFGIACSVGVAERTERLIVALIGIGLEGLKVPYALTISIWLLLVLGLVTVMQRLAIVYKGLR
jgi:CDP-diacylglycerol--glycerol-3-phosphate 3-phosphatidyltransferase